MTKSITIKQAEELLQQATHYLDVNGFYKLNRGTNSYDSTDKPPTKLSSGLKNIIKQVSKIISETNEEISELRWKNALCDDKTKALLFEEDGKTYKFTADGMQKFNKELKKLKEKEVTIHTRIQEDIEVDLDDFDLFNGIVIPEQKEA